MFKEFQVVRLKNIIQAVPLSVGEIGTVLIVHNALPPAYEVEFISGTGESLGAYTVGDGDLVADEKNEQGPVR